MREQKEKKNVIRRPSKPKNRIFRKQFDLFVGRWLFLASERGSAARKDRESERR
jgi:hypothetical protein